jgi:hypothetical protein
LEGAEIVAKVNRPHGREEKRNSLSPLRMPGKGEEL